MANTYAYKINTAKVASMTVGLTTLSDVVTDITEVRCIASNGAQSGPDTVYSSLCPKPCGAPDPANFTALASLTSAQVLAWAQALLPAAEWTNLQAQADAALAASLAASQPVAGPSFASS